MSSAEKAKGQEASSAEADRASHNYACSFLLSLSLQGIKQNDSAVLCSRDRKASDLSVRCTVGSSRIKLLAAILTCHAALSRNSQHSAFGIKQSDTIMRAHLQPLETFRLGPPRMRDNVPASCRLCSFKAFPKGASMHTCKIRYTGLGLASVFCCVRQSEERGEVAADSM